jgi:hypothetical protein
VLFRSYPIGPSGGRQIARTFQWGEDADLDKIVVNSRNLLVRWFRQDTTTFKPVFRASPVRVVNGPSTSTMVLSGIEEAISGSSPLSGRQVIEAKYTAWAYTEIGSARRMMIDGIPHGTLHLRDVRPGALDLPDAWTWELEFVGAYAT